MMHGIPLSCVPGVEWPGLPTAAAASLLALQWQLERSQWWSPERLLEHQFRQIRALAGHAVANVPYYRDTLRTAGVARAEELTPESFRRWPLLPKSLVRENESRLRALRYPREHGALMQNYTTGSTGTPLRVFHTEVAQLFAHALVVREHLLHERDLSAKFGAIRFDAESATQAGWGLMATVFATGPACINSTATDLDALLDWLCEARPAYLLAYPTLLRALVARSRQTGKAPEGLLQILSYGEMLPADLRTLARECWGVTVVDSYSCHELANVAAQCPQHDHYLVHAENVYVEVLRDDGEPCAPGETGRVVATPLHNFAMPLMRYEIGDYAEAGERCPGGRGLPVLNRVVGRVRNMLRDPEGRMRWPRLGLAQWSWDLAAIRQFRLVQHSVHEIEALLVLERELTESEQEKLSAMLRERLGYPFEIRITRVPAIERRRGEKYEEFVSLLDG